MPAVNPEVVIERRGTSVVIEIICADEYQAMLLYDKAIASLEKGGLKLNIGGATKPQNTP